MSLALAARAKVNLWLRVFPPDETGYHPLDTLFCALDLADEITIDLTAEQLEVDVAGADIGAMTQNLAYRAAQEFFLATGMPARAAVRLRKRVPVGAGLGGGSSDAAAVLTGLNRLYGQPLSAADMLAIGARLGSDVAFFVCGAPLAHATGRGEVLRALPALPRRPALIVAPGFSVSTGAAYGWLDEAAAFSSQVSTPAAPATWEEVAQCAHNDFETVVFRKHEMLGAVKHALRESGALLSLLSGSGSTVFGIYHDDDACRRALDPLRKVVPQASLHMTMTSA